MRLPFKYIDAVRYVGILYTTLGGQCCPDTDTATTQGRQSVLCRVPSVVEMRHVTHESP